MNKKLFVLMLVSLVQSVINAAEPAAQAARNGLRMSRQLWANSFKKMPTTPVSFIPKARVVQKAPTGSWLQRIGNTLSWPSRQAKTIYNDLKNLPQKIRDVREIKILQEVQPEVQKDFSNMKRYWYDSAKEAYKNSIKENFPASFKLSRVRDYLESIKSVRKSMLDGIAFRDKFAKWTQKKEDVLKSEMWDALVKEHEPLLLKEQRMLEQELVELQKLEMQEAYATEVREIQNHRPWIDRIDRQLIAPKLESPFGLTILEGQRQNNLEIVKIMKDMLGKMKQDAQGAPAKYPNVPTMKARAQAWEVEGEPLIKEFETIENVLTKVF